MAVYLAYIVKEGRAENLCSPPTCARPHPPPSAPNPAHLQQECTLSREPGCPSTGCWAPTLGAKVGGPVAPFAVPISFDLRD